MLCGKRYGLCFEGKTLTHIVPGSNICPKSRTNERTNIGRSQSKGLPNTDNYGGRFFFTDGAGKTNKVLYKRYTRKYFKVCCLHEV